MKLLLVEDEPMLSKIVAKGLERCGYAVDCAYDGEQALECYEINDYDLILLDLNLPEIDGLQVLQRIRLRDRRIKILILSARSSVEERVQGLNLGANDYLIKPFAFLELEARINNLLRQSFIQEDCRLRFGELELDTVEKKVYKQGEVLELARKEYAILEYLMRRAPAVVSSEELIEHVWDSEADLFSNSLKSHIYNLKKKLLPLQYIQNVRKMGYALEVKL